MVRDGSVRMVKIGEGCLFILHTIYCNILCNMDSPVILQVDEASD